MTNHEIAAGSVAGWFNDQLETYGDDPRSNGHRDADAQRRQFEAIGRVFAHETRPFTVYEVGCGLGDFSAFLRERFPAATYRGCDLNPRMLDAARRRHPGIAVEERDVLAAPIEPHDYVIAVSTFHIRGSVDDATWSALTRDVMRAMFAGARVAMATNFLTSLTDFRHDIAFHQDAAELLGWAQRELSRFIRIDHRYWPWEYVIEAYHEPVPARVS